MSRQTCCPTVRPTTDCRSPAAHGAPTFAVPPVCCCCQCVCGAADAEAGEREDEAGCC